MSPGSLADDLRQLSQRRSGEHSAGEAGVARTISFGVYALLTALLSVAPQGAPTTTTPSTGSAEGPVILFLVDNSASLPPLDPGEKRVDALERMFGILGDQPSRLVLFGGKHEVSLDQPQRYRNDGQWTDFYFALERAQQVMEAYSLDTDFRIVLVTDGMLDPRPQDWPELGLPSGGELRQKVAGRILEKLREINLPFYVILVGQLPPEDQISDDREASPRLILEMVQAANGPLASRRAQSLAQFFEDDGLLLKKFVYRVHTNEGLERLEPVVRRIVAASRPAIELQFLSSLILPLVLFTCALLGVLVRSFPGRGDVEVIELSTGLLVHIGADRFRKMSEGGWATTGLSIVKAPLDAAATLTYVSTVVDLSGEGLSLEGADETLLELLPLDLEELRKALHQASTKGEKDEKIYALNLNYMAANIDPGRAEQVLSADTFERAEISATEFLHAKAHLLVDPTLRNKVAEPHVQMTAYGKDAEKKDLVRGESARIGRYELEVKSLGKGGRKDGRLVLSYRRIPSLLGLKNLLPEGFQRVFRFRTTSWRVVS